MEFLGRVTPNRSAGTACFCRPSWFLLHAEMNGGCAVFTCAIAFQAKVCCHTFPGHKSLVETISFDIFKRNCDLQIGAVTMLLSYFSINCFAFDCLKVVLCLLTERQKQIKIFWEDYLCQDLETLK